MFSSMNRNSERSLSAGASACPARSLARCLARSLARCLVRPGVLAAAAALAIGLAALAQQPAATAPAPAQPPQQAAPETAPAAASQAPASQDSTTPAAQQPAAQDSAPAQPAAQPEPAQTSAPDAAQPAPAAAPQAAPASPSASQAAGTTSALGQGGITEEEIKQLLVGKELYLRGRYLDDSLTFNEHGQLVGHSPQGSYTLSAVQIERVRITKHKVELEGARYGLHFLGALPYEDPTKAVDRVKVTPKKKLLRITIDREVVVKPKKDREKGKEKEAKAAPAKTPATATAQASAAQPAPGAAAESGTTEPANAEPTDADEAKAEIAAAPPEERPADPSSVTTTTSPAHATQMLKDALAKIFAPGLDEQMMTSMPAFWQLYYQAAAGKTDYRPKDASVLRQNTVDTKAHLLTTFEPGSNEYAQANGVAGMALYHAVIGADGKPGEIAVARPIGFGLDENAVAAIQNAKFSPAIKDGKPVPVMLDLVVQFRIYSKRTAVTADPEQADKPAAPILPGPYSVQHPPQPAAPPPAEAQQQPQASQ
jgi:TonB family protein